MAAGQVPQAQLIEVRMLGNKGAFQWWFLWMTLSLN
jgi:hypothetical protein